MWSLFRGGGASNLSSLCGRLAFTLAEVLITIGIIGVVAAMVVPGVISNIERKRNAVILRKAYSDLGNYLQMYSVKYGCESKLSDCQERDGNFVRKFALYLRRYEHFTDLHPCTSEQNWQISYLKNSQGVTSRTAYYGCTSMGGSSYTTYYMRSKNGLYAYFIEPFPSDMYYHLPNKSDYFRLKVTIFTDKDKSGYLTRWGESPTGSTAQYPQEGRNMFTVFVLDSKRILPQGSAECDEPDSWAYYCRALNEASSSTPIFCSAESGDYSGCMQQVINDGWEIKYKY